MNELEIQNIVKLGNQGLSVKEVSVKVGRCITTVRKVFKTHDIKLPGSGGQNRVVNNIPFSNSEESMYWIGYLIADGHITKNKFGIYFSQASKDKEAVIRFRDFVNPNINLYTKEYDTLNGKNEMTVCLFGHKPTHEYLKTIGFTNDKSTTFKLNIPMNRHVLRGIFDGDGSATYTNQYYTIKITSASKIMVDCIMEFLELNDIHPKMSTKQTISLCYDIRILKSDRKKFYNLLYKDVTTFYLQRKHDKICASAQKWIADDKAVNSGKAKSKDKPITDQST